MADESLELLRGTLDLLILRALSVQPTHGYGVVRWIERATQDQLRVEEGSLYPALYRLEERGLVESEWGVSENNRKARFYRVTRRGRQWLQAQTATFTRFANAVFMALSHASAS
jgi:transcriptional regulator